MTQPPPSTPSHPPPPAPPAVACLFCGAERWEDGFLGDSGEGGATYWYAGPFRNMLDGMVGRRTRRQTPVVGKRCAACGYIYLFAAAPR